MWEGGGVTVNSKKYRQNLAMVPKAVKCLSPFVAYCGLKATSQNAETTMYTISYSITIYHTFFKMPQIKVMCDMR